MDKVWSWSKGTKEKEAVFVKSKADFIITDDLRVIPISLMTGFSLLEELRIKDASTLEEWVIDVNYEKALNLLRRSLISKRALTKVFFSDACIEPTVKCFSAIKEEIDGSEAEAEQQINVKIILNKKKNIVLFAEGGEDFADQLLSFLTFPFGSVFKLLGDRISLEGCISNLYSSAETLNIERFKSENHKNMVVFPKLASYYRCRNQMLKLDEMTSKKYTSSGSCIKCFLDKVSKSSTNPPCKHGIRESELIEQNPKLEDEGTNSGERFAEAERRFMVDDNLHISPISSISAIMKGIDLTDDLVEKDVSVDKTKVLSLLNAMLISKTVLTDVFSSKPTQQRRY